MTSRRGFLSSAFAVGSIAPLSARGNQLLSAALTHSEPCMGTMFTVRAYCADETRGYTAIREAFKRMHHLDAVLSDYQPGNELQQLCQQGGLRPFVASSELFAVLEEALNLARETEGAFDPTLGPLTRLWRECRKQRRLPGEDALRQARSLTGWQGIELHHESRAVCLPKSGMQLDFGGIAKGFAADQALAVLTRSGVSSALVAAGGDVAVSAAPPAQGGWRVAIETGKGGGAQALPLAIPLEHQAVSTSGDLNQFLEIRGKRYSHILDAQSGMGLTNPIAVSVVAPSATISDGVATALSVMGLTRAQQWLARRPGIAAHIAYDEAGEPRQWQSPNFPGYA